MYPNADVPAFQLSLDERRGFKEHLELGREIQSLRERGVLILGSGNIVHNLGRIDWDRSFRRVRLGGGVRRQGQRPLSRRMTAKALASSRREVGRGLAGDGASHGRALSARFSIAWAARMNGMRVSYPYEGFDFGSISMRTDFLLARKEVAPLSRTSCTCYILSQ